MDVRSISFWGVMVSVFLLCGACYAKKINIDKFQFFDWHNPAPRFADLGIGLNELQDVIGDTQLLLSHKPCDIELYSGSERKITRYKDARFVSSLTIFNVPKYKVFEAYLEFTNYPEMFSQYKSGEIVRKESNFFLVKLKQVYKFLLVSLGADFLYQYKIENNGDFSALLLEGDVGAGIKRLEFIPLGEGRTLVVNTSWVDMSSARFVYRRIIKSQPDMKSAGPVGGVAMETEQIKDYLEEKNNVVSHSVLDQPNVPIFSKGRIPVSTLKTLSELGTLVFVHGNQRVTTKKGIENVKFVSTLGQLPGPMPKVYPISSDFSKLGEYFENTRKVNIRDGDDGSLIDWYLKFGLGLMMGVGVEYTVNLKWQNKHTAVFDYVSGDLDPLHGAWEWMELGSDKTLLVFTVANKISDSAPWRLKLVNRIPNVDVVSSLCLGVLIVEKQNRWIGKKMLDASGTQNMLASNQVEKTAPKKSKETVEKRASDGDLFQTVRPVLKHKEKRTVTAQVSFEEDELYFFP